MHSIFEILCSYRPTILQILWRFMQSYSKSIDYRKYFNHFFAYFTQKYQPIPSYKALKVQFCRTV
nr:MAG TPA: hypothetical protein [Caudoviricetes sp.]